ncbi:MAG: DUF2332 family protein [Anaerolineae bacterium]
MNFQEELAYRFKSQADFAKTYSPLYSTLFSTVEGWLESTAEEPNLVATWLLETSQSRNPFDVTLLLMAGLHEAVLANHAGAAELAQFYPTANGHRTYSDPQLPNILETAILNLKDHLAHVIHTATVQTNETGRGSSWLLPLAFTRWPEVELLDLGASAGLNLVAEQRRFDFHAKESGEHLLKLGQAVNTQMVIETQGELAPLKALNRSYKLPHISSRLGVDLLPFPVKSNSDATRLTSYVWADQPERVERLSQALAILQDVQQSAAPVQLDAVNLPGELSAFLKKLAPSTAPLLIYNTYITQYFKNDRPQLRTAIEAWAADQNRPVLWVQWEPHVDWMQQPEAKSSAIKAEEYGWCAWTADLWKNGEHHQFHLGWVHPHGLKARFLPGLKDWADFWS